MFACTDATDSVNRYTMAGSCGIAVQSFSHFYYTLVFFFSQPFTRSPVRVARHFNQCIDNDVHAKIKYINLNEGNKNSISWNWRWNGFLRVCSRVCVFKRERARGKEWCVCDCVSYRRLIASFSIRISIFLVLFVPARPMVHAVCCDSNMNFLDWMDIALRSQH